MSAPKPGPRSPFGDLSNKSMQSLVTENKAAYDAVPDDVPAEDAEDEDTDGATPAETTGADTDAAVAAPAGESRRVVMIHHDKHGGIQLVPGVEYDLPVSYANALIEALRAVAVAS